MGLGRGGGWKGIIPSSALSSHQHDHFAVNFVGYKHFFINFLFIKIQAPAKAYGLGIIVVRSCRKLRNHELFDSMHQKTGVEGKGNNLCGQKHS